jgi:hypothetical protein
LGYGDGPNTVDCEVWEVEPEFNQIFFSGFVDSPKRLKKLVEYSKSVEKTGFPFIVAFSSDSLEEFWKVLGPGKIKRIYKRRF